MLVDVAGVESEFPDPTGSKEEGKILYYLLYYLAREVFPARVNIEEGAAGESTPVACNSGIL